MHEIERRKEVLPHLFTPLPGLAGRLLIGREALDPNAPVPQQETLPTALPQETLELIENKSTELRKTWWEDKVARGEAPSEFSEQLQAWSESLSRCLSAEGNRAYAQRLSRYLQHLGLSTENFTAEDGLKLYERYFREGEGIKTFIEDVISAYRSEEGSIDISALLQDLEAVQWFARIFGADVDSEKEAFLSLILSNAVYAQAKVQGAQEELKKELFEEDRINNLEEVEKVLLEYLKETEEEDNPPTTTLLSGSQPTQKEPASSDLPDSPWENLPRPERPVVIKEEKMVTKIRDGRRIKTYQPKTTLILGTKEHPLVVEVKNKDGTIEKQREISPERNFYLPTIVYFDEDVEDEEKTAVIEALQEIARELGYPQEFIIQSSDPKSDYFKEVPSRSNTEGKAQYNVDVILSKKIPKDPSQIEKPHYAIVITEKDLYGEGTNWVFGSALPDLGTVISLYRLKKAAAQKGFPVNLEELIKIAVAHEFLHVFNLPTERRGKDNLEYILGPHCKNETCVLHQSESLEALSKRAQNLRNQPSLLCEECRKDFETQFIQTDERARETKQEIFERAGKRSKEEMQKLVEEVATIVQEQQKEGKGKMRSTIEKMNEAGIEKIVHEGKVAFIPKVQGNIIVVSDIHGDLASLKRILDKTQFIENMEAGERNDVLVIAGDFIDRGPKSIEVVEVLLDLKRRYPNNVIIMGGDHETDEYVSHHDYPDKVRDHYADDNEELFNNIWGLFQMFPQLVVCGNGAVLAHGGPTYYELDLGTLARLEEDKAREVFRSIVWSDVTNEEVIEEAHKDNYPTLIQKINKAIEEANKSENKTASLEIRGGKAKIDFDLTTLHKIKERLELAHKNGFWFNGWRMMATSIYDVILANLLLFGQRGLNNFLKRIGGKVMIRGHQRHVTNKEIIPDIFWTIHSSGDGSPESPYAGILPNPTFAVLPGNKEINKIDPTKHIISVWD